MKTIFEHVEHIKGKPHHVRKRVAFGAATAVTALIALVWLAGSVTTGVFALKNTSFADSAGQGSITSGGNGSENGNQNIAGAAAAISDPNAPAHIEIIDATSSRPVKKAEQTTLPF